MSEKEKTGAVRLSDLLDPPGAAAPGAPAPAPPTGTPAAAPGSSQRAAREPSDRPSDCKPTTRERTDRPSDRKPTIRKQTGAPAIAPRTGTPGSSGTSASAPGAARKPITRKPSDRPSDRPAALSAVFSLLSAGANSKKMLREKLARKGFSPEESAAAIAEADRLGLIGEKRLLAAYVYRLGTKKFYGPLKIRAEAARKFDRASLDAYLDEAMEELDFDALARQAAKRCLSRGRAYVINKLRALGYDGAGVRKTVHALDAAGAWKTEDEEE